MNETTPNTLTPSSQTQPVPGFDILDGMMSIVLAPGRAMVKQVIPEPGVKDLPLILILSALTWGGAWWAYKHFTSETNTPKSGFARKVYKTKPVRVEEEEDE